MTKDYVKIGNLQVAQELYDFINAEAIPNSQVTSEYFWFQLDELIHDVTPQSFIATA